MVTRQIQRVRAKKNPTVHTPNTFKDSIVLMTDHMKKTAKGDLILVYAGPDRFMDPTLPSGSRDDACLDYETCIFVSLW